MKHATLILILTTLLTACSAQDDQGTPSALPDMAADLAAREDLAPDLAEEPDAAPDMADMDAPDLAPPTQQPPDLSALSACAPYVLPGPYKAGVTTIEIDGSPVEIWYPSEQSGPADTYDLRGWLPDDYDQAIPQSAPTTYTTIASRDVDISAAGPFPIVLFSHGFAAYRMQSSFLTAHLATWGYIVVAPEHPERGLEQALTDVAGIEQGSADVDALAAAHAALLELGAQPGSRFEGKIDPDHLAISGHSAGGAAAIALSRRPQVAHAQLVLAYTPAVSSTTTPIAPELVAFSGTRDVLTTAASIKAFVNRSTNARRYIAIEGAGHLAPSDLCVIGREQGGILKIAQDAGLMISALIRGLATNGCRSSDLLVERAWPIFTHMSVAHLRRAFGEEVAPGALDQPALDCFAPLIHEHIAASAD
jgi:dienelactone hydrolase